MYFMGKENIPSYLDETRKRMFELDEVKKIKNASSLDDFAWRATGNNILVSKELQ